MRELMELKKELMEPMERAAAAAYGGEETDACCCASEFVVVAGRVPMMS